MAKGKRWCLRVSRSQEQRRQWLKAQELGQELAAGPEHWRDRTRARQDVFLDLLRDVLAGDNGARPFSMSPSDLQTFDALTARMRMLLENAAVVRADSPGSSEAGPAVHSDPMQGLRAPLRLVASAAG